jgi:hypothetical protein
MSRKRTKKQKEKPRHPFLIKWEEKKDLDEAVSKADVKGQNRIGPGHKTASKKVKKNAYSSGKDIVLASVKKDIIKSLSLASLIIGIEVMLYLIW